LLFPLFTPAFLLSKTEYIKELRKETALGFEIIPYFHQASQDVEGGDFFQGQAVHIILYHSVVGIRGDVGTGSVLFRIFRDGQVIFYAREGFEPAGSEQFYLVPIQMVDHEVTPGAYSYTLLCKTYNFI
jgi:hypothetical protein